MWRRAGVITELIRGRLGATDVLALSVRTIIFADENFRDGVYLSEVKIFIYEMFKRDNKASSCNHDIDLVIGAALMFC